MNIKTTKELKTKLDRITKQNILVLVAPKLELEVYKNLQAKTVDKLTKSTYNGNNIIIQSEVYLSDLFIENVNIALIYG